MTKNVYPTYKIHIAQEVTTKATCWKAVRTDGKVFGFTSFNEPLTVLGVTYLPGTGAKASAIATSVGLGVDNMEMHSLLDSVLITEADIRAGLWNYARIDLFQVNWADLSMGQLNLQSGWIGQVTMGRTSFIAELMGITQAYQQEIGRLCMPACDADLGDARCGVNLVPLTVTGSITSITDTHTFVDSSRTEADGWFEGSKITWTSGLNNGLSMEVKSNTGTTFVLQQPMPFTVQIGDTYSLPAGCIKSPDICRDKFDNAINFRGFPNLPGVDAIVSGT